MGVICTFICPPNNSSSGSITTRLTLLVIPQQQLGLGINPPTRKRHNHTTTFCSHNISQHVEVHESLPHTIIIIVLIVLVHHREYYLCHTVAKHVANHYHRKEVQGVANMQQKPEKRSLHCNATEYGVYKSLER